MNLTPEDRFRISLDVEHDTGTLCYRCQGLVERLEMCNVLDSFEPRVLVNDLMARLKLRVAKLLETEEELHV